ncbi:TetR/AcrR family transcriptional regulator [Szabonella alba]|uniref:TetR family transcriptional regulator C-terminal domain-containing protein n=1 Tax=Szabonella alba TaxID=2804194 RepID=A0A8K0XYX4_9RHOB|nr:TetR family transcriptional regulator C-terminal domain-containing protein [Szabonella alba]MBL4916201.1 TetR family transcriptional regulator C-terminal domain-containing protein [Szabonella alba]
MTEDRRKFIRQGEEARREALIAAALSLMAESGPEAATVRAIADRAGVTAGLIRHYFDGKDELMLAAYGRIMGRMTENSLAAIAHVGDGAEARLAGFVAASLRPPVMDPDAMGLWAGFLHLVRRDARIRAVHRATYLEYRDQLQRLIAALPRQADARQLRADAIACNGVIDGLWLEGSALPDAFDEGELVTIGLQAVGAILGLDLAAHLPPPFTDEPAPPETRTE